MTPQLSHKIRIRYIIYIALMLDDMCQQKYIDGEMTRNAKTWTEKKKKIKKGTKRGPIKYQKTKLELKMIIIFFFL